MKKKEKIKGKGPKKKKRNTIYASRGFSSFSSLFFSPFSFFIELRNVKMATHEEGCVCIFFSVRLWMHRSHRALSLPTSLPFSYIVIIFFFFFALLASVGRLVSVLFFSFLLSMFLFFFVPLLTEALHDCVEATSRSSFSSCFLCLLFLHFKKKTPLSLLVLL